MKTYQKPEIYFQGKGSYGAIPAILGAAAGMLAASAVGGAAIGVGKRVARAVGGDDRISTVNTLDPVLSV